MATVVGGGGQANPLGLAIGQLAGGHFQRKRQQDQWNQFLNMFGPQPGNTTPGAQNPLAQQSNDVSQNIPGLGQGLGVAPPLNMLSQPQAQNSFGVGQQPGQGAPNILGPRAPGLQGLQIQMMLQRLLGGGGQQARNPFAF